MNPDTIDLSTWRGDAPPTKLRARIIDAARASQSQPHLLPRLLPRVGIAGAVLGGVAIATLLATAPARAEAFVRAAQRALAVSPRVHVREFVDGRLQVETWFQGDRWRVTSPVGQGGDRIFRYGLLRQMLPEAQIRRSNGKRGSGEVRLSVNRLHSDSNPSGQGLSNVRIVADGQGEPMALTYWSRRNGKVLPMLEVADQTRDFRMEALAPRYFPKGASLRYRDRGSVARALTPVRLIEVTSENDPATRLIWTVRESDGLPVRLSRESGAGDTWREVGSVTFEYPSTIPAATFDPETLAEHGP